MFMISRDTFHRSLRYLSSDSLNVCSLAIRFVPDINLSRVTHNIIYLSFNTYTIGTLFLFSRGSVRRFSHAEHFPPFTHTLSLSLSLSLFIGTCSCFFALALSCIFLNRHLYRSRIQHRVYFV